MFDNIEDVKKFLNVLLAPMLKRKELKLEFDNGGYLTIYREVPLNYAPKRPKDYKWRFLVACNVYELTLKQLQNRILLITFDALRSESQHIHGIQDEYKLIRKGRGQRK